MCLITLGFPGGSVVKAPPANAGDAEDEGSAPELPFSSPGGLLDSGIKPGSPALQADS